ncbi:MAG: PfkB family carbohydrate kinase [Anaerolineales bacterium]
MTQQAIRYTLVGAFAQDKQPTGDYQLGGTVFYSGVQAARLGAQVNIISSAAPDIDLSALDPGILAHLQPALHSTIFENRYDDAGNRTQTVSARTAPLNPSRAPALQPDILHLGPLLDEVAFDWVDVYPGARLAVTPQGWLRSVDARGHVHRTAWADAPRLLSRAWACVFSEEDVQHDEDAIAHLASLCPISVCTRNVSAASIFVDGQRFDVPTYPAKTVDPTGAGDVFAAAFFIKLYETDDPLAAARFAHIAAARSIEGRGVSHILGRAALDSLHAQDG